MYCMYVCICIVYLTFMKNGRLEVKLQTSHLFFSYFNTHQHPCVVDEISSRAFRRGNLDIIKVGSLVATSFSIEIKAKYH